MRASHSGEPHAERSGSETHEPQPRLRLDERAENNQRHACRNGLGQPGQRPIVQREGQRKRGKAGETRDPDRDDRRRPGRGCVREKACRNRERDPGAAAERPAVNRRNGASARSSNADMREMIADDG